MSCNLMGYNIIGHRYCASHAYLVDSVDDGSRTRKTWLEIGILRPLSCGFVGMERKQKVVSVIGGTGINGSAHGAVFP